MACSVEVYKCVYMTSTTTTAAAEEEPAGEQASTVGGGGTTTTSKTTILSQQGLAGDREVNISSNDGNNTAADGASQTDDPANDDANTDTSVAGMSGGALAGIVVTILVVAFVAFVAVLWYRKQTAGPEFPERNPTDDVQTNPAFDAPGNNDSSSSRRDTVVTRQAGIIYAIPVDEGGDDPGGYAVPLDNYAIAVNNQQSGGGGSSNHDHEYAIPQARLAPLLPLDLDGYVIDDTSPESTGGGRGDAGGRQSEGTPAAYGRSVHGPGSSDT